MLSRKTRQNKMAHSAVNRLMWQGIKNKPGNHTEKSARDVESLDQKAAISEKTE
uniref:Uncharacterized protein n=1 Tax=Anguilla anguilla TaxID=7936 RepID=A0A0E9UDC3_ANGAN